MDDAATGASPAEEADGGDPRVSVVVPAHDAAETVGAAISSVLSQTVRAVEVVVVDDGSTDGTARVVEGYTDPRVRLVRQPRSGPSGARNSGLRAARGALIAFLDADDYLMPGYLAACLERLGAPRSFVTANAFWMYDGGIRWRGRRHPGRLPAPGRQRLTLLQSNWVSIMSVFPRALLDDVGRFDEDLDRAEDWDFWLRAVFAGWRVVHQPQPLALFNRSRVSQTSARRRVHRAERQVLEKMARRSDLTAEERRYVDLRLASGPPSELAEAADAALRRGDWSAAGRGYSRAARLVPAERALVVKARLMTAAPGLVGPVLRRRDLRRHDRRQGEAVPAPDPEVAP